MSKLHLWDLSFHLAALDKRAEALGRRGRGLQRIVLAACKPGAPAPSARPASPSVKKFSYPFSRQVPALRYLPTQLGHFAFEYLADKLGFDKRLAESERDLDDVLKRCLVAEDNRCDIFTLAI